MKYFLIVTVVGVNVDVHYLLLIKIYDLKQFYQYELMKFDYYKDYYNEDY
jgi:hypothetical protein